jgi:protein-L-isoaspartate(D-aspartate) O-methyltransferase
MIDTYRHKGLRRKLVKELQGKGIEDVRILEAIGKIPRHFFLDRAFEEKAYKDIAFPIDSHQTISQPYTVAFQTFLLQVKPGDRILEIGTGSGYQACVLAELGAEVFTIERHENLYQKTRELLREMGYHSIHCYYGDGFLGIPSEAPFDKIIVTAAAPEIPQALLDQLRPHGLLVIPYGAGEVQKMLRIQKDHQGVLHRESFDDFSFVPMLKGTEPL